jgi:hypothetical protein
MNRLFTKSLAVAALTLGALATATSAQARDNVQVSIGVQVPGLYLHTGPIHVQPRPVYVQPVYLSAPSHHGHFDQGRRYEEPRRIVYNDRGRDAYNNHGYDAYPRAYPMHNPPQTRAYGPYGDLDRDGVVNLRDHDRDGDGVRNRNDRHADNPYRR